MWIIISPEGKNYNIQQGELQNFVDRHYIDWRTLNRFKNKRKIQIITRTELGYTELKHVDATFYEQIQQGVILWERI